jgi:hypothetical protein
MEEKIICSLNGVEVYGIISICIFVAFFTAMLVWALTQKRNYLDQMGGLPLDGDGKDAADKTQSRKL